MGELFLNLLLGCMLCCLKQAFLKAHLVTQELWNPQEYLQTRRRGCKQARSPEGRWEAGTPTQSRFGGWVPTVQRRHPPRPPGPQDTARAKQSAGCTPVSSCSFNTKPSVEVSPSSCCRSPRGTMRVFTHNQCSDRMLGSLEEHLTCGQTRTHAELCLYHRSEYKYCYKHYNL